MSDEQYKSLLIVNESKDASITLYIYGSLDFVCWMSFRSKIILPGEKYLYRSKDSFKFDLVARVKGKSKETLLKPKTWDADIVLKVTSDQSNLRLIEGKLEDFPSEKRVCLRKLQRDKELSTTSGKRNLYAILGLDMDQIRRMPREEQKEAIKKGFREQIKRWHPDKNFGNEDNAKEIIMAHEVLLDDEMRARYHNKADYHKGWLSLSRWRAIFNPERFTIEQKEAYKKRLKFLLASLVIAPVGIALTVVTAGLAAPAVVAAGAVLGGAMTGAGLQSLQHTVNEKSVVTGEFSAKQWALKAGIGFVSGAAIAGVAGLGSSAMESAAVTMGQYMGIGAGTGAVCGAVSSIASDAGRKFVDGEEVTLKQVACRAAFGATIGAAAGIAGGAVSKVAKRVKKYSNDDKSVRLGKKKVERVKCSPTCSPTNQPLESDQLLENETSPLPVVSEEACVHEEHESDQLEDMEIKYISEGAWTSRMIVSFFLDGKEITKTVSGSGKFVTIPSRAKDIEVKFQVRRPFWGDVMKYNRFRKAWVQPYEPHVFRYDKPTNRTFTISGNLWWEAVMGVTNEYHDETKEL